MVQHQMTMKKQLEDYFDVCVKSVGVDNISHMSGFRFAVTMNFLKSYIVIFHNFSVNEGSDTEKFAALCAMEMQNNLDDIIAKLNNDLTLDEKMKVVVDGFYGMKSKAYDMVADSGYKITAIENLMKDFHMMAAFISDGE